MADHPSNLIPGDSPPGSPRRASVSLQAAATVNAGLRTEVSRRSSISSSTQARYSPTSGRRRSTVLMNLQINDPSVPAPGEMVAENQGAASNGIGPGSPRFSGVSPLLPAREPHHSRAPSLGELHQELEEEQEAQVNRLLQMIRQQQLQLQQLQVGQGNAGPAADDSSAVSERSATQSSQPGSTPHSALPVPAIPISQSPRNTYFHPRSSFDMARADLQRRSRTPSRGASLGGSPRLRAASIAGDVGDGMMLSGRDESAFYQAETQMLVRENQMLKHRIRELEKQLVEAQAGTPIPHEPSTPSLLVQTTSVEGGGVVGLAAASALAPHGPTLLLERHTQLGTETSSRNSEVIHAGIYYGTDTHKAELCIRGRGLLYDLCERKGIPHRKTGKWIVAQNEAQRGAIEKVHETARALGVPTRWVSRGEVERDGEGVLAAAGCLESPETGIVDSHGLMMALAGQLEESGGTVALNSRVTDVSPLGGGRNGDAGWEVSVEDPAAPGEASAITADVVVNAAGLGAVAVHNMIVPPERRREMFYAKGNYFSYSPSSPRLSRLIYPAPEPGKAGLGTHLTLDLAGRIRFGPDVEWVDSPDDLAVSAARLGEAVRDIRGYLPGIDETGLVPDYVGIRPKLSRAGAVGAGKGFQDFIIRREEGFEGWVNLLGIESPGLTSSLAIGERVERILYG
ncbi:related to FAD dependent oxidoreductase [Cephalotrichum gorgonifer]|uniref:L-2-hydroxyglutarate dehydrogenase, mitochondrial n=1 Tax=Cephalotrichum gorgonifer TaxID=2041049 RepID=A0AAE8N3U6_9PEZI|nr:related to FAD dependent oxidoreductase [Cephalotrichum gorgonifer]